MNKNIYNIVDHILVPHTALEHAILRIDQCYKAAFGSAEPICIALIGESRTGKSRVLEHFASQHPKVRLDDGLRVPILRVRTPSNPSAKGLAEVMLRSIGDPNPNKGTETNMTARLICLLKATQTRMIMIDEFQHFYDKKSHKVMHHVADWLKLVADESQVALVVSGLPSCQAVLNQNEQLAGRFLAPIRMPRFDWNNPDLRAEFKAILGAFQEGLTEFSMPSLNNDEMAFRFYCATGGLMGYVAKVLRQAVWNAIDNKSQIINLDNLAQAHRLSVYTDEKAGDLPLAFDYSFAAIPSESLLERVHAIGINTSAELIKNHSKTKPTGLTVAQVLHK